MNNKEKNFISVVIYIYNNENKIAEKLRNITNILKENFEKYEIICVNDASTDKSLSKIQEFAKTLDTEILSVINMSYYHGIELAMNAGVNFSIGDYVYEFDNILYNIDNKLMMQIYEKCLSGYDIVSTTPKKSAKSQKKFYKIFNKYSNLEYELQPETFRILSRRAINRVFSMSNNIPFRQAIYANCGLNIYNIVYHSNENVNINHTKEENDSRKETEVNSLILFTSIGYKFARTMSLAMIFITLFVACYTVFIFVSGKPVQGWTTTMMFLSIGFLGIFVILSIIIKYLEILLNLSFKKRNYMIKSIDKLN